MTASIDTAPATESEEVTGHSADIRGRILRTAMAALEHGGEQSVRIRDVTEALGVSVGAIYHHFGSREGLIVAARIEQFDGAVTDDAERLEQLVREATDLDDFHTRAAMLTREAYGAERAPFRRLRAEVTGVARHHPELARALADAQRERTNHLVAIMGLAKARGFVDPSLDDRAIATLIQALPLGLVVDDINHDEPMDPEAWVTLVTRMFRSLAPRS